MPNAMQKNGKAMCNNRSRFLCANTRSIFFGKVARFRAQPLGVTDVAGAKKQFDRVASYAHYVRLRNSQDTITCMCPSGPPCAARVL